MLSSHQNCFHSSHGEAWSMCLAPLLALYYSCSRKILSSMIGVLFQGAQNCWLNPLGGPLKRINSQDRTVCTLMLQQNGLSLQELPFCIQQQDCLSCSFSNLHIDTMHLGHARSLSGIFCSRILSVFAINRKRLCKWYVCMPCHIVLY